MLSNQGIVLAAVLLLAFVALDSVHAIDNRHNGGGRNSRENYGTTYNSQCRSATKFLYQWLPQSPVTAAFQAVCARVGVTQAWNLLQGQLGVPATGALNQATFQALLANTNQAALAQQLLTLGGVTLTFPGK